MANEVKIEDSVLLTVKSMIGPSVSYDGFDLDLITHINSALMELAQLGVLADGTEIVDKNTTWQDILGEDKMLNGMKSYLYFRTKIMFDPPASSTILNSINEEIKRLEWRMWLTCDERRDSGAF